MSPLRSDTRNRIRRRADGHEKGPHYAVEPVDGQLCGNWTEPMSRPEVSILIPAYNEAQAIGDVVAEIARSILIMTSLLLMTAQRMTRKSWKKGCRCTRLQSPS